MKSDLSEKIKQAERKVGPRPGQSRDTVDEMDEDEMLLSDLDKTTPKNRLAVRATTPRSPSGTRKDEPANRFGFKGGVGSSKK